MLAEEGYDEERAEVYYWIGSCLLKLNDPAGALAAFNGAARLDPHNAAAYRGRGDAYEKLGQKDKAEADFELAERLEDGSQ